MSNSLQVLSDQARAALKKRDWQSLQRFTQQILAAAPSHPEGHFLSGVLLIAMQQPQKAITAFSTALSADKNRYDAAVELANALVIVKQNKQCLDVLSNCENQLDQSPKYLNLAATCYVNIGFPELAEPLYRKALALQPDIGLFQANLASCLVYTGKLEEAYKLYQQLLKVNPQHQRNHYYLSRITKAKDDTHVLAMQQVLEANQGPQENNIYLHYALGKELEDLQQWQQAFEHYKIAGDAATRAANYQLSEDLEIIEANKTTYNEAWFNNTAEATYRQQQTPIFILGLPRTGSTLVERIVGSHSQVTSIGETQFMPITVRALSGVSDHRQMTAEMIRAAANADMNQFSQYYFDKINYRLTDKRYFIEKLPYNSLFTGLIHKAFPNAKIVWVTRNPADSCFSMYKQVFTWAYKFSYNLENLGQYYFYHRTLLEHWQNHIHNNLYEINYENLIANPEGETERLLAFLDLDMETSCLNFHQLKTASTTASAAQVRDKLNSNSVGKWHHFQDQLKPLTDIFDELNVAY